MVETRVENGGDQSGEWWRPEWRDRNGGIGMDGDAHLENS